MRLFITLLLGMLAYLASRNVVLCVLLNFTVPFALVFFQSDQFAPKGYFGYAMTFVFLELRPPTPEEFPVQMLCLLFCTLVLIGNWPGAAGRTGRAGSWRGWPSGSGGWAMPAAATSTCQMGNGGFITCLHCCFSA